VPADHARRLAANLRHATLYLADDQDHSDVEERSRPPALGWLRNLG
jgi:hypothetical protein